MQTLHELFVHGLNDILDAEQQLVTALGDLASDCSREDLKEAFESHRIETEGHVRRLRECFALLNERPQNNECRGVRSLNDYRVSSTFLARALLLDGCSSVRPQHSFACPGQL